MAKAETKITTLEDEVSTDTTSGQAAQPTTNVAGENFDDQLSGIKKTITIHVSELEGGSDAVPVSLNGYMYQIPRGIPVTVPTEIVEILANAVQTHYTQTPAGVVERKVPRFAYSVL